MKNKKAQNFMGGIVLTLLIILVAGGLIIGIYVASGTRQQSIGEEGQVNQGSGGIEIVTTDSIISVSATDEKAPGTTVGLIGSQYTTGSGRFSAVTLGTTTAKPGNEIELLLINNTQYHNVWIGHDIVGDENVQPTVTNTQGNQLSGIITVDTKTFPLNTQFKKNASVTEVISYPYSGLNLNNGGGANNITGASSLNTFILNDKMYGSDLQSTQDLTCVYELENGTTASTTPAGISVSGNGAKLVGTGTPSWYSYKTNSATARVWVYDMPPITTSGEYASTITIKGLSTVSTPMAVGSRFVKTCYTKEYFNDANNGISYGVADSNNVIQSMAIYEFTAYFGS